MSERYCYDLWQSSLNELQTLLNEKSGVSQDKDVLAKAYLRYLQILKQLDEVHTHIRQPQQREAVATALLCCAGLLTESWSALVTANKGIDVIDFNSYLVELQLTPDDLEVPIPAVLKASDRVGQGKLKAALAAAAEASTIPAAIACAPEKPLGATTVKYSSKQSSLSYQYPKASPSSSMPLGASVESNTISSDDAAATEIQTAWRAWRDRRSAADIKIKEFDYIGMSQSAAVETESTSSVNLEEGAVARRERRQKEYEQARLEIEELLQVQETPLMVLEERNQVNSWLEEKIKSERERWPEVPLDGELSAATTAAAAQDANTLQSENQNPKRQIAKQKPVASARDATMPSPSGKASKLEVGKKGGLTKNASANSSSINAATTSSPSTLSTFAGQLESLIIKWRSDGERNFLASEEGATEIGPATVIGETALKGLPLPRRGSSIDAIDLQLLTTATRPHIKDRVRRTVREQARQVAAAANAAHPVAPVPLKQKQSSGLGSKPAKASMPAAKVTVEGKPSVATKSTKPGTRTAGEPREPKREPLPPLRDVEEIFKELAVQNIALKCPEVKFSDFIGTCCLVRDGSATGDAQPTPVKKAKSGGKAANVAAKTTEPLLLYPNISFAQIRQLLTVKCALPLAIQGYNANQKDLKLPNSNICPVTALIYGPRGSGKTMLVHAIAHESKAALFDLSPKTLAGKYPGQQSIDVAIQSVFAAAKAAAPAIIYIDNAEQIFIRDEKRAAQLAEELGSGCEPVGRIRRQLLLEIEALKPENGVLVLCTSREPQACVSADEASFISFFQFLVHIPLPDDRCRREILQKLALELKLAEQWTAQQLSLAAQLTHGYTAGALKTIMTRSFDIFTASTEKNVDILDCFVESAAEEMKPDGVEFQTVAEWTARAHAMLNKSSTAPSSK